MQIVWVTRGYVGEDGVSVEDQQSMRVSGKEDAKAAGHRLQLAFEFEHAEKDCRAIISEYARCGGDNGIGVRYMRAACGLPPLEMGVESHAGQPATALETALADDDTQSDAFDRGTDVLSAASAHFAREMNIRGWNVLTQHYSNQIMLPSSIKTPGKRKDLWDLLKHNSKWLQVERRGKVGEAFIPKIHTARSLWALYAPPAEIDGPSRPELARRTAMVASVPLPEMYSFNQLRADEVSLTPHGRNSGILIRALRNFIDEDIKAQRAIKKRGPVKPPEEQQKRWESLCEHAITVTELLSAASGEPPSQDDNGKVKRRRLQKDVSYPDVFTNSVNYIWHHDWRCRRYAADFPAAQAFGNRLQSLLLQGTVTFNISNAMPTLLCQLVDRLDVIDKECWGEELHLLRRLCDDRAGFCKEDLGMPETLGKQIVLDVLRGGAIPEARKGNTGMQKVARLARFLRWLAVDQMGDVYLALLHDPTVMCPEAKCLSFLYEGLEDHIVEAVTKYLQHPSLRHLSLHFGDIRVDTGRIESEGGSPLTISIIQSFCATLSSHIHASTGYQMRFRQKHSEPFVASLRRREGWSKVEHEIHPILLTAGNCIPLAIAHLRSEYDMTSDSVGKERPTNVRSYRDAATLCGAELRPAFEESSIVEGAWLVHCTDKSGPHCVALHVDVDGAAKIFDQEDTLVVGDMQDVRAALAIAIDTEDIVFFQLITDTGGAAAAGDKATGLLDLLAGASESSHREGYNVDAKPHW